MSLLDALSRVEALQQLVSTAPTAGAVSPSFANALASASPTEAADPTSTAGAAQQLAMESALTGSDTASNVLFGGLQKTTAEQLGLSPILMSAANSSGGVMGKMIDAQSIVVASTATKWYGHEGDILRYVFFHSLALAFLVGLMITLQAYVEPFTRMVVH